MLTKLNNILIGNQFIGLEIFTSKGDDEVSLVRIEKKKNELLINHAEKQTNFDQLKEKPQKNDCVFLIINNSHIIQKEVDEADTNEIKIVKKAFPNLKLEDFYYEICRIEAKSIVAICRKNYIDELLSYFQGKGVVFSGISLGVCSISQIISYCDNEVLKTNSQTIRIGNQQAILDKSDGDITSYQINGLEIQNSYLLGFSTILSYLLKPNTNSGNIIVFNNNLSDEYFQKKFFINFSKIFVFCLLIVLLINFFIFNYFFKAVNNSTLEIETNKNLIENIKIVKLRLRAKEERLNRALNDNNSRCSFLLNKIISEIPTSILLNQIIYHPLERNIKDDEEISTQNNIIIVAGKTINNAAFTNWIEQIQKYKEIDNVIITQFGKNETKETVFTLKIAVNEVK